MTDSIVTLSAPQPLQPPARSTSFLLWRAIRKHWLMMLTITAAVTLAVAFFTLSQKKIYSASMTMQIDPTAARPLGNDVPSVVDVGGGQYWTNKEYFDTQLKLIRSRRVAERTVRMLDLHRDPAFIANLPPGQKLPSKEVS